MIEGIYFDGQSTRRLPVEMAMLKRIVAIRGEGLLQKHRLSKLVVSERLAHAPRIIYFPDGGCVHITDRRLDAMLRANGYCDSRVVEWQQNWLRSVLALIGLVTTLITGYQWGLPWAADTLAQHLPTSLEKKIGDEQWKMINGTWMASSRLDTVDQNRLRQKFAAMTQPHGHKTAYRLEFRNSKIGPNAFALPNGVIVMTDQLVMLARNDDAVLGVLGHELGHLQRRHSLRRMVQAVGVGVMVNLWVGDVSSLLAALPAALLDSKYSRDFEREADKYAIDMMRANRLPMEPMAQLFEKMHAVSHAQPERKPAEPDGKEHRRDQEQRDMNEYFSSHPADDERIKRLRAADRR